MKAISIELEPNQTVLVLGGYGFLGRHIVTQLESLGASVIIGTRRCKSAYEPQERQLQLQVLASSQEWLPLLEGVNVVINAVGILRERLGESYQQVHHLAVASLAKACATKNIRLVHISVLGLSNPVNSRFLTSKRQGEQALIASFADWYIVRPSLVDGEGGYGAKWFRRIAKWPIHLSPGNAAGKLTPLTANDLGEAIAKIALRTKVAENQQDRIYELGGQTEMSLFDYLEALSATEPKAKIRVPAIITRPLCHLCDLLHFTPFSYGHYELLKYDNVPVRNQLPELLGRPATRICHALSQVIRSPWLNSNNKRNTKVI